MLKFHGKEFREFRKILSWQNFPTESPICACIDFFHILLTQPSHILPHHSHDAYCFKIFLQTSTFMCGCFLTNCSADVAESVPVDPFQHFGGVLSHLWLLGLYSESWCQEHWYCMVLALNRGGNLPFPHFHLQERNYVSYMLYLLLFLSLPKISVPFSVPSLATGFSLFCLTFFLLWKELQQ